jgi:hypothetical protein
MNNKMRLRYAALCFGVSFFVVTISMWTLEVDVLVREYEMRRGNGGIDSSERTSVDCALWKRERKQTVAAFTPDLNLNIYPSRDGSKEFIMCSYPKTGCSQMIMLLNYLWKGEKITTAQHDLGARSNNMLARDSPSFNSTTVPRILIMRDPYKRTVSSYHDFKRRARGNAQAQSMSFEDFIGNIVANSSKTGFRQPRDHRRPISEGCSNPSWIHGSWDYVFQLELMPLWLPCFQEMLNLTHIISGGWRNSSLFKTVELSVQDKYRLFVHADGKSSSKAIVTGHENPEEDLHTPYTIEVVNRVFFNDFVLGGYKLRID